MLYLNSLKLAKIHLNGLKSPKSLNALKFIKAVKKR